MAASAAKVLEQISDQVGNGPEFEFEDPASSWVGLVQACRIKDPRARRAAVERCLVEARNSHWTQELWEEELAICAGDQGVEWGTDTAASSYIEEDGMQPSEGGSDYVPG